MAQSRRRILRPLAAAVVVLVASCTSAMPPGSGAPSVGPTAAGPTNPDPATTEPARPSTSPATDRAATTRRTSAGTGPAGSTSATGGTCVAGHCYTVGTVYELGQGTAPESSGIVASATSPGVFFVVDDGTGTNRIDAVRSDGSPVANVAVQGMSAGNAEALSAGPCGDRSGRCFYIGDIGDNDETRSHITVIRISEPPVSPAPKAAVPADAWDYTYPDEPHNAEAMVIEGDASLIVITKSAISRSTGKVPPHRIYRGKPGGGELVYVSSFTPPDPAHRLQSLFTGTVVTDASYSRGRMLLLTYDEVIEYLAPSPTADPATFPSWPHHQLPAPPMIQSEGITADITGCGYEVTSEEGPGGTRAGLAGVARR